MEEIKKIEVQGQQYGVADMLMRSVMGGNAQVIEWSHTHNMNDYKEAGTYRIKGERTGNPLDDNLPIMNQGSGHTIEGILYVLDSSLTNGSGKTDDCTITQFLMLSNRVGGQEGDMYMRSAYGATKDNLTWKPWEKYQTNMEVGCVSDYATLNPSNPNQVLDYKGMYDLIDNGIYSGIYFSPQSTQGTNTIINQQAIETFVMVVINNYAAAGDARCITQIKFAVTNGGVFSMEKRSVNSGSYDWSQWESVGGGGGGLPENVIFYQTGEEDKHYFGYTSPESVAIGSGLVIGDDVRVGRGVTLGNYVKIDKGFQIGGNNIQIFGHDSINLLIGTGMTDGVGPLEVKLGNGTYIGENVTIGEGVEIKDVIIGTASDEGGIFFSGKTGPIGIGRNTSIGDNVTIGASSSPSNSVHIDSGIWITKNTPKSNLILGAYTVNTNNSDDIILGKQSKIGANVLIDNNIRIRPIGSGVKGIYIGTNTEENDLKIEIDYSANKIIFSYFSKTAELPLTESSAS